MRISYANHDAKLQKLRKFFFGSLLLFYIAAAACLRKKSFTILPLRLLGCLPLLTGCLIGPNYHRPLVPIPEAFHYAHPSDQASLNLEWWKQFGDTVLVALIEEAVANNKDVKIAAANIVNAIGILIQTRAPLFPQAGYTGSYNRTRLSETLASTSAGVIVNPQTTLQALANASWDIDLWGRTRRLVESAQANVFATYDARQQVILSLVVSVASSYIELRGLDEQLEIAVRTQNSYGEEVRYFELQLKYGQASQMTVAQAQTQYEIASSQVPQLQSQIAQTENALCVLLGRNPGPIARGKSISNLNLPAIPAELPSALLKQRPDIRQAEEKLIAANAQIGAAEALYFPSISLTGAYGGASQQLSNLFSGPSNTWSFTGSLMGPIFTAGAIYGQVLQTKALQQAALFTYERTIQNAFAEVENALVSHTMLVQQLLAEELLVKAAGEYQRLAMLQYKAGYSPYFIVIQAQEQYFPAQLAWAQTRTFLCTSLANIYGAMGGGWVSIAEGMTDGKTPPCLPP